MSIDRDTFDDTSEDDLEDLSVPDQVLGFLVANDVRSKRATLPPQLADEDAVSTVLSWLKDGGLVEHRATYWVVIDGTDRRVQ